MNTMVRNTCIVLLGVGGLGVAAGCGRREAEPEPPVRPVITMEVTESVGGRPRTFAGVTRGEVETPISFRVGGEIAELPVQSGDEVEEGQLIASLDKEDFELNVRRLEAQRALAAAQEQQAVSEYERVRSLFEADNVSRSDFDQARSKRKAAEAQLETAREALNQARQELKHATRNAPQTGTIIAAPANRYQFVSPGQPVAVLRADHTIVLEITVAETLAGDLAIGQPATATLEAFPGRRFDAAVSEIGAGMSGLAAVPVKVRLKEPPELIRSGQAGEAEIVFEEEGAGVTVPLTAVTGAPEEKRFVWVVDSEASVVERRAVETGRLRDGRIEVRAGLSPGERIVTRGANRVSDEQEVRVIE